MSLPPAARSTTSVSLRGPAWGWAGIAGLAVLVSLAAGVFGVLAWRIGARKPAVHEAPAASPAPAPASPVGSVTPLEVSQPPPAARLPAPAPSGVEFELDTAGPEPGLIAYLDTRRAAFANCAIGTPAAVSLIARVGTERAFAVEYSSRDSTSPAVTECVIAAFHAGTLIGTEGRGRVLVRIPARGAVSPPQTVPGEVGFELLALNFGSEDSLMRFLETRRASLSACAVPAPTQLELMASRGPTANTVSLVDGPRSPVSECVIAALRSGAPPSQQVIARLAVRLPAGSTQPQGLMIAPDPNALRFDVRAHTGSIATATAYADGVRAELAACAVERDATIPLEVTMGPQGSTASEHRVRSSTAPMATRCVIDAFISSESQRSFSGTVTVHLPARRAG